MENYKKNFLKNIKLKRVATLCFFLLVLHSGPLHALEIRLLPPTSIYNENNTIHANFLTSENLLDHPSNKNFDYNIPFTITYYIELHKKGILFNKVISDIEIIKHVQQNLWSKHFFVKENGKETKFDSYLKLNTYLTSISHIPLTKANKINSDDEYFLKTRIAIKIRNFASFYYLINNLVSLFEYRTTYISSKIYSGKELLKTSNQTNK